MGTAIRKERGQFLPPPRTGRVPLPIFMVTQIQTSIIQARNVKKIYRNGHLRVEALKGIDMSVAPGEIIAIMGQSGCGKTTLLNCLSGLDTIDEGDIFIRGENLRDLSDNERTAYRA